ncbi:transmembrane protein 62-like isoform X2 [Anneissia japonica]|nr:transmembrane protein 62-like isoform X2 [Anneissia japonica]
MLRVFGVIGVVVLLLVLVGSWCWEAAVEFYTKPVVFEGVHHPNDQEAPYPGGTMDNLWWFVHISDVHISRFKDPSRTEQFKVFCDEDINAINPPLVIVTGDLTDAKRPDHIGSEQYEIEWQTYWSILKLANIPQRTHWVDIRGNHDTFHVLSKNHENSYFKKYSISGQKGDTDSFLVEKKFPFGTYSFIALDALLDPGPGRPFNFFGVMEEPELKRVEELSQKTLKSNQTIYFGHYPTSIIITDHARLTNVLQNGIAYLCGHLHSLMGNLRQMKALQRTGSLELEVEDWKDNRKYRVVAFDHDMLSFGEKRFEEWPLIVITNPKSARFMAPKHEPVGKMQHSTHIRVLVFSPDAIASVSVFLNDQHIGEAQHVEGPLYVLPWKPNQYANGLHQMKVIAKDAADHISESIQEFSLDGSRPLQWLGGAIVLMTDVPALFLSLYAIEIVLLVVPLVVLRRNSRPIPSYHHDPVSRAFIYLVHHDFFFYSLILIGIFPVFGPWIFGRLVQERIGISLLYGIYVEGKWIPEKFSYAIAFMDMLFIQLPITIFLAACISHHKNKTIQRVRFKSGPIVNFVKSIFKLIGWLICYAILIPAVGWQWYECVCIRRCYGDLGLFLSPVFLWRYFLFFLLIFRAHFFGVKPLVNASNGKS